MATRAQLRRILRAQRISPETVKIMARVDRRQFVPRSRWAAAYVDRPLSIGYGVTISQPSLVGKMVDYLRLEPISTVLELGTGSAYNARIIADLVPFGRLTTVERVSPLAARAKRRFAGRHNVTVVEGDATAARFGHPFDRIVATAEFLNRAQMARLVEKNAAFFCIAVYPYKGVLWRMVKCGRRVTTQRLMRVRFVPVLSGTRQS
uniref:protein-L-isoaspartate(D-aspartate) O-methyltransferase n=1 Tax=Marseillevirus LCMAC103 TaxID=2506604 RepID=A0A481YU96_9VIRU|nr:MAG: protein-L-isoaspartate(D-aspartate) O-methyltransferase [Marseillevirus LCMAC103]